MIFMETLLHTIRLWT